MSNMLDYLAWRGDLPVGLDGWNAVDALILASCCYHDFAGCGPGAPRLPLRQTVARLSPPASGRPAELERWELLRRMAESKRFGETVVHDYVNLVDPARSIQFSALTADFPDGSACVAFRGTDSTLVGWREDFNMAFETPVPSQAAAVEYLSRMAQSGRRPLRVAGHSKGGNLAVYSAAHADVPVADVYSFDGPGLDEASTLSEGYARVRPVIRAYVPQASVVGMLMAHHPEYTVVRSTAAGPVQQHNLFTWQLVGTRFVEVRALAAGSQVVDQTVHRWLRACTPEQRRVFVNTLFDVLESTDAVMLGDMLKKPGVSAAAILEATRRVDPQAAQMIVRLLGRLLQSGAESVLDRLTRRADDSARGGDGDRPAP